MFKFLKVPYGKFLYDISRSKISPEARLFSTSVSFYDIVDNNNEGEWETKSDDVSYTDDIYEKLNSNEKKKFEVLRLQIDMWRHQGFKIPQVIKEHVWFHVLRTKFHKKRLSILERTYRKEKRQEYEQGERMYKRMWTASDRAVTSGIRGKEELSQERKQDNRQEFGPFILNQVKVDPEILQSQERKQNNRQESGPFMSNQVTVNPEILQSQERKQNNKQESGPFISHQVKVDPEILQSQERKQDNRQESRPFISNQVKVDPEILQSQENFRPVLPRKHYPLRRNEISSKEREKICQQTCFFPVINRIRLKYKNHKILTAMQFGLPYIIDLRYENLMYYNKIGSLKNEMEQTLTKNRDSKFAYNILFCNVPQESAVIDFLRHRKYLFYATRKSYLELYPKKNLVYLTPHSNNVIEEFNADDIYIVGGYHDFDTFGKRPCFDVAFQERLRTAKLPLRTYGWKKMIFIGGLDFGMCKVPRWCPPIAESLDPPLVLYRKVHACNQSLAVCSRFTMSDDQSQFLKNGDLMLSSCNVLRILLKFQETRNWDETMEHFYFLRGFRNTPHRESRNEMGFKNRFLYPSSKKKYWRDLPRPGWTTKDKRIVDQMSQDKTTSDWRTDKMVTPGLKTQDWMTPSWKSNERTRDLNSEDLMKPGLKSQDLMETVWDSMDMMTPSVKPQDMQGKMITSDKMSLDSGSRNRMTKGWNSLSWMTTDRSSESKMYIYDRNSKNETTTDFDKRHIVMKTGDIPQKDENSKRTLLVMNEKLKKQCN